MAESREHRLQDSIRSITGLNIVLGALILVTPFFTATSLGAVWNNVILGAIVMGFAGYGLYTATQGHPKNVVPTAIWNIVVGVYTALSPLWLATGATFAGANVLLGLMLVGAAGYNVYAGIESRRGPQRAHP